jgi:hypothetical protein
MKPLSPKGMITLFVDGAWGVELPEHHIKGTCLKDGDSVSSETMDILRERNGKETLS